VLWGRIPEQTLIVFTGDEEGDSRGAEEAMAFLGEHDPLWQNIEVVISLDLTEEFYGRHHFTIENFSIEEDHSGSLMQFNSAHGLQEYLSCFLSHPAFIKDAEGDDTWEYAEHDVNCFTFCLPCKLLGSDMHDSEGVAILTETLHEYAEALALLLKGIHNDLKIKKEILR